MTFRFQWLQEISNERIGYASGPIWLDQVSCLGNETCLDKCMHFAWGESNCNHTEDISIRCSHGSGRKSAKLLQLQDHNSLSEFDEETQQYIREIQRSSKSMPDYSNVCGKVKVSDDDVTSSAEMLGQFRVISGTRTKRGHHPWQATIRARGRNGRSSHWCGAVVISKNHILTAAHCLVGFPKGAYFIRLGDHHSEVYEDSEVEIFIEDWFTHEEFRKGQHMNNDIAVILLKQPIQFSNYIQPICLPTSDAIYAAGRNCTISGWGSIQYGKSSKNRVFFFCILRSLIVIMRDTSSAIARPEGGQCADHIARCVPTEAYLRRCNHGYDVLCRPLGLKWCRCMRRR